MVGGPHFMRCSRDSFRTPIGDRFRLRALLEHHRHDPLLAVAFEEAPSRVPMHEGASIPGAVAPTPTRGRGAFGFTAGLRRGGRGRRAGGQRLSRLSLTLAICASMGGALLCAPPASAAAPQIEEEWVTEVSASSALLQARINAEQEPTTYRFEYATSESALLAGHGEVIPSPPAEGDAGEGEGVAVQVQAQNLRPSTAYYFRAVATNADGEATLGEDRSFTTPPPGSELVLPDGREWELVTPPEKHGFQVLPARESLIQASQDGSAISYTASGPAVAEAPANLGLAQFLSRRGPSGWSSQDIAPPQARATLVGSRIQSEYLLFSSNLAYGLVEPFGTTLLSSAATERTPYVRDDATGEYEATVTPGDTLPGTKIGEERIRFVAANSDLSHPILEARKQLTAQGPTASNNSVYFYEWAGGQLQLIDELAPGMSGDTGEVSVGAQELLDTRHAVSEDGSRVFWGVFGGGGALYMRNVPAEETVAISKGEFQDASSDGSEVFYTESVAGKGTGLYVYNVEASTATLLTVTKNAGEEASVKGVVLGASEDGSYVYFVAGDVLSENENAQGEKATSGANNLYVGHSETRGGVMEWKTSFIAALSEEDRHDWDPEISGLGHELGKLTAEVSPDGRYVAFMSERSLTGYDNIDANSGQRDEELYVYDAQSGRLVCGSCDPSGARPVGRQEPGHDTAVDLDSPWVGRWVAASVPGWLEVYEIGRYQPRYLSDTGRLFFDSPNPLVSPDTNGTEDVYEYEPEGVGDCASSSATYSARSAGCIALISGGRGAQESIFLDASASGNDVFFASSEDLVAGESDGLYDVYDAHACSAEAPCTGSGSVVVAPTCDTAESCKAPPSPQPAIFGAPASATFTGSGNVTRQSSVTPVKPKATKPKAKRKAARCARGERLSRGRCVRGRAVRRAKTGKTSEDRRAGR